MLNILICDDDAYTARVLEKVVKENKDVGEVFIASNGLQALEIVKSQDIDVALMDIDMPIMDGLEAAKSMVSIKSSLKIIFITAHRDYAYDSYEVKAYDYILKPIDFSKVRDDIRKIAEEAKPAGEQKPIIPGDLLIIRDRQDYHIINMSEINYIEKEHNTLVVHTTDERFYTNTTLSEIEKKLTDDFLRTHRSYLVNLKNVQRIEPYGDSSYIIYFKDTDEFSNALITREKMRLLQP